MKMTMQRWTLLHDFYVRKYPDFFAARNFAVNSACRAAVTFIGNAHGASKENLIQAFDKVLNDPKLKTHPGAGLFLRVKQQFERMDAAGKTRWVRGRSVLFVPFARADAVSLIDSKRGVEFFDDKGGSVKPGECGYLKWNLEEEDIICLGAGDKTKAFAKLMALRTPNDVLYICGHCRPGSNVLGADNEKEQISVEDLVKKLCKSLSLSFAGQIKIYGCHSAADFERKSSFVQKFADAMLKAGYKHCSFHGYTEELSTARYQNNEQGKGPSHKWAGDPAAGNRAASSRMRVYPTEWQ